MTEKYQGPEKRQVAGDQADIPGIADRIVREQIAVDKAAFRKNPQADISSLPGEVANILTERGQRLLQLAGNAVKGGPTIIVKKELSPELKEKEDRLFSPIEDVAGVEKKHSLRPSQLRELMNDILNADIPMEALEQMLDGECQIEASKVQEFRQGHENNGLLVPILLPSNISPNYSNEHGIKKGDEKSTIMGFKRLIQASEEVNKGIWHSNYVRPEVLQNTNVPFNGLLIVPTTCIEGSKGMWFSQREFNKYLSGDELKQFQVDLIEKLTGNREIHDRHAWMQIVLWLKSAITGFSETYFRNDYGRFLTAVNLRDPLSLNWNDDEYSMNGSYGEPISISGAFGALEVPKS